VCGDVNNYRDRGAGSAPRTLPIKRRRGENDRDSVALGLPPGRTHFVSN